MHTDYRALALTMRSLGQSHLAQAKRSFGSRKNLELKQARSCFAKETYYEKLARKHA